MRRILCAYLPELALERLTATYGQRATADRQATEGQPAANGRRVEAPAVIVSPDHGGLRVVRANGPARRCGVRAGQTSAEAAALARGLVVHPADETADRRALERLAAWADCLSPVVSLADDDGLLVDVTGCSRVFGGEERLGRRAVDGLTGLGFTAQAAIADTPGAAWALAHVGDGDDLIISPPGQVAAALARLPVWALRVSPQAADGLRRVGVETVEALLHLPRSAVAKRFGDDVLHRLDQALGDAPELLIAFNAPPVVRAHVRFTGATDRWEHLHAAVSQGVSQVCAELDRRVAGVRRLLVTFHLSRDPVAVDVDADVRAPSAIEDCTIALELSRATRDAKKLVHLARTRLESVRLAAKVEAVTVWSRALEGLDGAQQTWFDTMAEEAGEFGDLLDRLALRLGPGAVVHAELVADHQPERAYAYAPAEEKRGQKPFTAAYSEACIAQKTPDPFSLSCRPVRLLREPAAIQVLALLPDGPVLRFRWSGRDHTVVRWSGPERVETGWWRSRRTGMRRDYYRVEDEAGRRYWVFKNIACAEWFLHGMFD